MPMPGCYQNSHDCLSCYAVRRWPLRQGFASGRFITTLLLEHTLCEQLTELIRALFRQMQVIFKKALVRYPVAGVQVRGPGGFYRGPRVSAELLPNRFGIEFLQMGWVHGHFDDDHFHPVLPRLL